MSTYIRYELENIEPLRITDDAASQSGQVAVLKYIPGTAIRGLVVNALKDDEDFESIKQNLFSEKVSFLNAYIMEDGHELIPSPKGFYEDKARVDGPKSIENLVVNGDFTPGFKRAGLGNFCYIEDGCINYYNVQCGSDLKIKVNLTKDEKRNVFRNDYIRSGYIFVGYIRIDNEKSELADRIQKVFDEDVYIGNARFQGLGRCRLVKTTKMQEIIPYASYVMNEDIYNTGYMMLVSDTVMLGNDGEPIGLNETELASLLGLSEIKIKYAATSIVEIKGYNRKLRTKTPSIWAYEKGSVFKLDFEGQSVSKEKANELMDTGLGIHHNTGMGRVIFLKDYDSIKEKLAQTHSDKVGFDNQSHGSDSDVLKTAARNYYMKIVRRAMVASVSPNPDSKEDLFPPNRMHKGQAGRVEAIILQNRYDISEAKKVLEDYFTHEKEKEDKHRRHDDKKSIGDIRSFVNYVMNHDLDEVFGCEDLKKEQKIFSVSIDSLLQSEEIDKLKMEFILMKIRMNNRKGDR